MFAMDVQSQFCFLDYILFCISVQFLIKAGITLMINCSIHAQYYTLVIIKVVAQKRGNCLYQLVFPYSCGDQTIGIRMNFHFN